MENLRVLVVEPGKVARVGYVEHRLEALQAAVGGYIEVLSIAGEESMRIICNEEGKLKGLEPNRALRDWQGNIWDILVGTFLVIGINGEEFTGLTDEQLTRAQKLYGAPERWPGYGKVGAV